MAHSGTLLHEAVCLDALHERLFFLDDFEGDQLKDEWAVRLAGSAAVVDQQTGGVVRLSTGATQFFGARIDWGDIRSLLAINHVSIEFRMRLLSLTLIGFDIGLTNTQAAGTEWIDFNAGPPNYNIETLEPGGSGETLDSGVAMDTDWHIFRIVCHTHGGNHAHFFIDDLRNEVDNSPIYAGVPTGHLQAAAVIFTLENVNKDMDLDYIYIRQLR